MKTEEKQPVFETFEEGFQYFWEKRGESPNPRKDYFDRKRKKHNKEVDSREQK